MERLTYRTFAGTAHLRSCRFEDGTKDQIAAAAFVQQAIERLAQYEDTGLEPEELCEMKTAYDENQIPYMIEATGREAVHLYSLLLAEAQGRLVELPYKAGTPVFTRAGFTDGQVHEGTIEVWEVDAKGWCLFWASFGGEALSAEFPASEIGETVFLSREDAEKAMEGRKRDEADPSQPVQRDRRA